MATKTAKQQIATEVLSALQDFNNNHSKGWTLGESWTNVGKDFETFVNKYLFPKISSTAIVDVALGNRFDWLAKEVEFVSQYSEEYVVLDTVPVAMNLSKNEELMLKRNYPKLATRLYGQGILKKTKFTLNENDVRFNFLTLEDATSYALAVYRKAISDINVMEEREIKAMLIDYSLNHTKTRDTVTNKEQLFDKVSERILNIQNNSEKYNESHKASGGALGRYTTVTDLKDVCILTSDSMKAYLLDTKLANTFQVAGLDLTSKIMSFDDLGGVWKTKQDIKIANESTVVQLRAMGDYQTLVGDTIQKDTVFTFDVSHMADFTGKVDEVKPTSDIYAYVFDLNKLRYKRNTKGMLKKPFENPEFGETTHWVHYYSLKTMSPFYNNVVIGANLPSIG